MISAPRLRREQVFVLAALLAVTILAWLWLIGPGQQGSAPDSHGTAMPGMDMPGMAADPAVTQRAALFATLMWAVMMAGMMLPGATPMILLFTAVQRRRQGSPLAATAVFLSGYAIVWGGFAVLAALAQVALSSAASLSSDLSLTSRWAGAAVLAGAAAYELSPLKYRCLQRCRGPIGFVAQHWRPGRRGALTMGLRHGAYCLGCCWALMLLLFVGGVMNLVWVAALGALVLVQKLLPGGRMLPAATAGLLLLGAVLLIADWR